MKKFFFLTLVTLSIFFVKSDDFSLIKNIEIYQKVLQALNTTYVDEIDFNQLVTTSIKSMLKQLDPYTVYYPEKEIEDARILTNNSYTGIGIITQNTPDGKYISKVLKDSPAEEAGLKAGYKIVSVNGHKVDSLSMQQMHELFKGEPNTSLLLQVAIPGTKTVLSKIITRRNVKMPAVSFSGMLDSKTGYIKLENFTQHSYQQVKSALESLKKLGSTKIILDLRNNPGGLLSEAVNIVSLFVPQGTLVAYTKGKNPKFSQIYKTQEQPVDTEIPVVILVNSRSASASEIVSGALKDLDRAVIIGERTFGKGLVQITKETGFNTMMKLTVAKYYIPSGRCIQAIDYSSHTSSKNKPDSLLKKFFTQNGRIVYEGKGIAPDIFLSKHKNSEFVDSLNKNMMIKRFVAYYLYTSQNFKGEFSDWQSFEQFLKNNYKYVSALEQEKQNLILNIDKSQLSIKEKNSAKAALEHISFTKTYKELIEENKTTLKQQIEIQIKESTASTAEIIKYSLKFDTQLNSATKLINNLSEYKKILNKK